MVFVKGALQINVCISVDNVSRPLRPVTYFLTHIKDTLSTATCIKDVVVGWMHSNGDMFDSFMKYSITG